MRHAMKLLCGVVALAGLHCGGEPLTQGSNPESTPTSSESELIRVVIPRRNPDRTWSQDVFYRTRQEVDAIFATRAERIRLAKEGKQVDEQRTQLAAAPAEIGPGACSNWETAILGNSVAPNEGICCVIGPDVDRVDNMCAIPWFQVVWSSVRSGWYADDTESCFGNFPAHDATLTGCNATWIGQDY